jgi:hypothetical protein
VEEVSPSICPSSMVDCSNYNQVKISTLFDDFQGAHSFCTSCRGHHSCGMIKSPLECLKSQPNGFTQVVTLDSLPPASLGPDDNRVWAHLLIEAWVALEGERESFGLSNEKPVVEELMERITFHRPQVSTSSFTTLNSSIH